MISRDLLVFVAQWLANEIILLQRTLTKSVDKLKASLVHHSVTKSC